jgi:hypothetical protein
MKQRSFREAEVEHEGVTPPLVYVYDEPSWEYKHQSVKVGVDEPPGEAELNRLGSQGWELVGVLTLSEVAHFYFKRRKD